MSRSLGTTTHQMLRYVYVLLVAAVATVFALPLLWLISSSLKPGREIFTIPVTLWSRNFGFGNFVTSIVEYNAMRATLNSVVITSLAIATQLLVSSLAAYALGTMEFKGRNLLFLLVLSTMMMPATTMIVSRYFVVTKLKLIDSFFGIALPASANAVGVFLLRQYYITIPRDYFEAAVIDGASDFTIYRRIALPITKPVMAALIIYIFNAQWKELLWPMLILHRPTLQPLTVRTQQMMMLIYDFDYGAIMAISSIAALIGLLVFFMFQKRFVEGLSGSVKG